MRVKRTTTKEKIAIMQASEDGEIIDSCGKEEIDPEWIYCSDPCWNWYKYEYRVRPEPRVFWVNIDRKTNCCGSCVIHEAHTVDPTANNDSSTYVKVIECLNEKET